MCVCVYISPHTHAHTQKNTGKVKGTASEMLDMRVEQVWLQGYTGQGVTTAVVDDG